MAVVIGLLVILVIVFYKYLTWHFGCWKRLGVAGPKPYPYVGTYPKTLLYKTANHLQETTEIYRFVRICYLPISDIMWNDCLCRKYFRKHRFIGAFECREPKLIILDPNLVSDIYVKYFKHFGDNTLHETVSAKMSAIQMKNVQNIMFSMRIRLTLRRTRCSGTIHLSRISANGKNDELNWQPLIRHWRFVT